MQTDSELSVFFFFCLSYCSHLIIPVGRIWQVFGRKSQSGRSPALPQIFLTGQERDRVLSFTTLLQLTLLIELLHYVTGKWRFLLDHGLKAHRPWALLPMIEQRKSFYNWWNVKLYVTQTFAHFYCTFLLLRKHRILFQVWQQTKICIIWWIYIYIQDIVETWAGGKDLVKLASLSTFTKEKNSLVLESSL